MKKNKAVNRLQPLKPLFISVLIFILIFGFSLGSPKPASAQIVVFDPVNAGINAVIQAIEAANEQITAVESHIEVELSALKYVKQGQQYLSQLQNMQAEASSLMNAVSRLENTITLPASEARGLYNSYKNETLGMQGIIAQEKSNPLLAGYLRNFDNNYGHSGNYTGFGTGVMIHQYSGAGLIQDDAAANAGYAQNLLNNSQNNNHMITQLSRNLNNANGTVSAIQASGQATVYLAKELAQTNKLLALKAKMQAAHTAYKTGIIQSEIDTSMQPVQAKGMRPVKSSVMKFGSSYGTYPSATGFGGY